MECTLRMLKQKSLTKAAERATSAEDCRRVSVGVGVQQYSVQCKGYNLIGVTTVEASETRGTTALVYWLINSSLYTGSVHVLWSVVEYTPTGLTVSRVVDSSPQASQNSAMSVALLTSQNSALSKTSTSPNRVIRKRTVNSTLAIGHLADPAHC
jgi:hypothetical protein